MRSTFLITLSIFSHIALIAAIVFGPGLFRSALQPAAVATPEPALPSPVNPAPEPVATPPVPAPVAAQPLPAPVAEPKAMPAPTRIARVRPASPKTVKPHLANQIPVKPEVVIVKLEEKKPNEVKPQAPPPQEPAPVLVRLKDQSPGGVEAEMDSKPVTLNAEEPVPAKEEPATPKKEAGSVEPQVQVEPNVQLEPKEIPADPVVSAPTKPKTTVGESN